MPILKGLTLCIRDPTPLRNEITSTPDFWSIIRSLHIIPEAAGKSFDLVAKVVYGPPPAVTADNYKETVSLLNRFAAAGSVGAVIEQKRDNYARRKEKPSKPPPKSRYVTMPFGCMMYKLTSSSENDVVERGYKAVVMIYKLTSRVPALIEQSHLERNEGSFDSVFLHSLPF